MDVAHAIRHRRTIHAYQPERPLPEGALERALEAAHWAPNHRFTYPWRFSVVGPETRERLIGVAVRLKSAKAPLGEAGLAALRTKFLAPSALVVFRQVLSDDAFTREEDYASLACAAQNFMLSLQAEGVGSKWGSGGPTRDPETYEILGLDREEERIVGFLWVGYPAKDPSPPARPALEDFVQHLA